MRYIHRESKEIFDGMIECQHERLVLLEEYEGSPYLISWCPDCDYCESSPRSLTE